MKIHLPFHMSWMQVAFVVFILLLAVYVFGALMGLTVFDYEHTIHE